VLFIRLLYGRPKIAATNNQHMMKRTVDIGRAWAQFPSTGAMVLREARITDMANITHQMHDTCIAVFKALKLRHPELTVPRGTQMSHGSPECEFDRDLCALDDVASSFSTGLRPSAKASKRVAAILLRETVAA
jgi:hypothetical protein